ncbi:MAG: HD domain-containing phosphohydrolase [Arcobacteraceae bacterium]
MQLHLKSKLLFLSFLPITFILILFVIIIMNVFEKKEKLEDIKKNITEAKAISRIIHYIQIERGLSSTYVSRNNNEIKILLLASRNNSNQAISDYKYMLEATQQKDKNLFTDTFKDIMLYRHSIDTFIVNSDKIIDFYSEIVSHFQNRIKELPSIMEDKENSTYIRAYDYLLHSKESLGKIRALLSDAFINTTKFETMQRLSAYLEVYNTNSANFQTIASAHLLKFYHETYSQASVITTFEIIHNVLNDRTYRTDSLFWFEQASSSINLLNIIEKEIFNKLTSSIDRKINATIYSLSMLFISLGTILLSVAFLMRLLSKKILFSTNQLEQSYEESLQLLEQYKATVDTSFIVSKTDPKGNITYVNSEFCLISGYEEDELLGKSHNIIRHPDTPKEVFRQMWHTIKEEKKPWRGEVKNLKKDGGIYWVKAIINPILNSNNEVIEYISIRTDLTQVMQLHLELDSTQREIIYKMGEIGETRSKETGNHVKRVAYYSKLLAQLYGLSAEEANILFMASPMHDIGKVGIPDSILNKAGKLTPEEFEVIKSHTTLGYNILKNSEREILKTAAIVAYEHHEKWDGSGYPRGLEKEQIHIFGRITAVADVFDALGHDRIYKKAWEIERVLEFFKKERGKHFDPLLIDLFFKNLDKFKEIKGKFEDVMED